MSRLRIVVLSVLVMCASILVPASAASGSSNAPMQRASGIPAIGSFNWSGYAVTSPSSARFTYVHSRFVQPALSCPGVKNQVMSAWVGLDGFTNGTVEQTGTAAACKGPHHTDPVYYAWYEMFPANSVAVFPVAPGDVIDTVVSFANKQFTLTVSDLTSGRTKSTTATCAGCKRASAEWIVERPASCKTVNPFSGCFIDALANFDTVTMTQNLAQLAGGKVSAITAFPRNKIVMVDHDPNGGIRLLDTTSALGGQSFTETWLQAGSIIPIQL